VELLMREISKYLSINPSFGFIANKPK